MRKLQKGDIVKVKKDETGELLGCVGRVVCFDGVAYEDEGNTIGVECGEADNTVPLYSFDGYDKTEDGRDIRLESEKGWGAWFVRNELRYSPKLNPSPIRCVPE